MKIKVILTETIKGIGKKDEIIEVKDGYANNFLLNKNKAVLATPENINKLQKKNEKIEKNHARDVKEANELKNILAKKEVVLKVKAGENGKLFGAITSKEIASHIKDELGLDIDKKKIEANIKALGPDEVVIKLFTDVKAVVKINVIAK